MLFAILFSRRINNLSYFVFGELSFAVVRYIAITDFDIIYFFVSFLSIQAGNQFVSRSAFGTLAKL